MNAARPGKPGPDTDPGHEIYQHDSSPGGAVAVTGDTAFDLFDMVKIPDKALDAALFYAEELGWIIVPACWDPCTVAWHNKDGETCSQPGKRPLVRWKDRDRNDPNEIRRWWQRWPDANIAVITGRASGPILLDVDNGAEGGDTLAKLMEELGKIPPTFTVQTPGKPGKEPGLHFYLNHPGGHVKLSAGELGPGLDVRGDNGIGILPPSRRHGGQYVQLAGSPNQLGDATPAWAERLQNGTRPKPKETPKPRQDLDTADLFDKPARSFTREQAQEYVNEHALRPLRDAPEGKRNHALNNAAVVLGHFAHVLGEVAVIDKLTACALAIGLDDDEISATIRSGLAAGMAEPYTVTDDEDVDQATGEPARPRRVDLTAYLDGTYTPPKPSVGARRVKDGIQLLYPAKWHTVIGMTGCGKSWLAVWHAAAELGQGNTVAYLHFEEARPSSTLARFLALGVPLETIRDRLVWLDTGEPWKRGQLGDELAQLDPAPTLVILDGINAACSLHGWPVNEPDGVGAYRETLEKPATRLGAAVLSLGHPVKDRTRQGERHGYGSGDWLNLVDGVGLRMEAGKPPIHRGARGAARLYSVKDRDGNVERHGTMNHNREAGWWYLGAFIVDDDIALDQDQPMTTAALLPPAQDQNTAGTADPLDELGNAVIAHLEQQGRQFPTVTVLRDQLRAAGVTFTTGDLAPALERLADAGRLDLDRYEPRKPRGGRIPSSQPSEAGS
jgi:hypothetical protein